MSDSLTMDKHSLRIFGKTEGVAQDYGISDTWFLTFHEVEGRHTGNPVQ